MTTITLYRLPIFDRLDDHAADRGWSTRELGRRLEVAPTTVGNWLRGTVVPTLDRPLQMRLARLLEVSPREVLELFALSLDEQPLAGEAAGGGGDQPADAAADEPGDRGEHP